MDTPDYKMDSNRQTISEFIKNASELAKRAVTFDCENRPEENLPVAVYFYYESVNLLNRAYDLVIKMGQEKEETDREELSNLANKLSAKITEYHGRIKYLQSIIEERDKERDEKETKKIKLNECSLLLEKANFIVNQALVLDENLQINDLENQEERSQTIELYTQAVELCLRAKSNQNVPDKELTSKIVHLAEMALERAETLKGVSKVENDKNEDFVQSVKSLNFQGTSQIPNKNNLSRGDSIAPTGQTYTDDEKRVLYLTSTINRIEYVPFMNFDLARERFAYPLPYSDKNGLLALSPKQQKQFQRWARPEDLFSDPKMFINIDPFSIKQTIVSDCSFVASLSIAALYEKRFKKRLISGIIYPQNKKVDRSMASSGDFYNDGYKGGEGIFNPCGKYMVKFNINGISRKIVIDDQLPVGSNGQLLCSYSKNRGEMWVSLLEKAYMKVMGGYDFPGSNSNIDLHALTSWIPERVSIKENDDGFDKDGIFNKLKERLNSGDVLATVATGMMSDAEADRAGLVATHAYALLDVRDVKGIRLFLLKNPWSHLRWRGNFSELDTRNWTEEMKKLLKYDPLAAKNIDDGVFWIDYDSICKFFDVVYMNWNPAMFPYTSCIHKSWHAGLGPIKDVYNIGDNPQYRLEVNSNKSSAVWVLLTRHITDIQDFKENREYITVVVYDSQGKKIYYPYDPPPLIDGVRINSPHYLCKILVDKKDLTSGSKKYTLVISQYEKMNTIHYTLRVYSTCPFSLNELLNPYKFKKQLVGEWKGISAGGCANHPSTYSKNPKYQLAFNSTAKLCIDLKGPKIYPIGFDIWSTDGNEIKKMGSTGSYRQGFVYFELNLEPGKYHLIPTTFTPNSEGPFFLTVQSSVEFGFLRI